jgi:DNA primase
MTRDIYIGRLCEKYGVSRTALTAKIEEIRRKNHRSQQKKEISEIIRPKFTKDDINPDRRRSPKATSAEETLIAVLLQHPDFCEGLRDSLPPDKFVTSLNRRIYEIILSVAESGRSLDISVFAQKLLPAEIGYLVSLQNSDKAGKNAKTVLKDCIEVILEENMLLNASKTEDLSVEDWALKLQDIINNKKGN